MGIKLILAVGLGSGIGGMMRHALSSAIRTNTAAHFPWHTLAVNIAGCFLIGLVFAFFDRNQISHNWKLFLATGILGGFTTFSAFSIETVNLLRDKHFTNAMLYVSASVILGLLATFIAYQLRVGK
ncbi:MAG: fluoride efflux transporter CrcB [Kiritimatiellaeota bacterium]|nr:fluoride efflux transporter CrcB [Kiritimatiellota bacterium]